jgi:adenosylmethionine-8-amino-7-oxononanoate aminotransferase
MLQAIELVSNKETKESWGRGNKFTERVTDLLDERGLISRVWSVMHFAPPLTVTKDEIDRMVTIADEVLTIAEGEFASDIS